VNFITEVLFHIYSEKGLPGSGSEMIYYGSDFGSGSGKKFRIQPDPNPTPAPDPQHFSQLDWPFNVYYYIFLRFEWSATMLTSGPYSTAVVIE
jgi:hypothetical protein